MNYRLRELDVLGSSVRPEIPSPRTDRNAEAPSAEIRPGVPFVGRETALGRNEEGREYLRAKMAGGPIMKIRRHCRR